MGFYQNEKFINNNLSGQSIVDIMNLNHSLRLKMQTIWNRVFC